jgi:hypothetical protein
MKGGIIRETAYLTVRNKITADFESSQALPVCPSGRYRLDRK